MSRLVTKPSFRYFAYWKSDVRQRWQFFTILKTNAATMFFLATLPVVLRTVLGSAISANCASKRNITLATKSVARRVACKMMRQPASVT